MELTEYLRFAMALAVVLALILGLSYVARRYGSSLLNRTTGGTSARRLAIVETIALDGKRRAMLISRDDVEHLIILGVSGETHVETVHPATARTNT